MKVTIEPSGDGWMVNRGGQPFQYCASHQDALQVRSELVQGEEEIVMLLEPVE